jgi:ABC-type glycerol-3-phosphate transport system substrate-binding protein
MSRIDSKAPATPSATTSGSSIGRRRLLKLAASSLAAGALAAPTLTESARAQSPTTITVWTWGGVQRFAPRVAAFKRLYPEAAARINVQVVSPGKQDPEVYQALRLALTSGSALPDLVQMDYVGMPEFAESGALTDLKEMMAPYEGDLVDTAKQLTSYNGQVVAIPFQLKPKVWFYRKDLFEQAGLDPAKIKSFDDYIAAGHRLREKLPKSYIMNIGNQPDDDLYWIMLSNWDDVRVADRDGTYQITRNPHFAQVLDWLSGWRHSGIAFNTDNWSPDWQPAFADDTIAGCLIASWMTDFLAKFAPRQGGRWAITAWPEFDRRGSNNGGSIFTIPAGAKNKDAAFEFAAKMLLQPKGALNEWQRTGNAMSIKSVRPQILELARTMQRPAGMTGAEWAIVPANYFGRDFMRPIFNAFDWYHVPAFDPAASAELTLISRNTQEFLAGKKTRDQALHDMETEMKAQIGNPYKS